MQLKLLSLFAIYCFVMEAACGTFPHEELDANEVLKSLIENKEANVNMQSQAFAEDDQEQARLRNIQRQQHAHTQQHLQHLQQKQESAQVFQQQYTAPQNFQQQMRSNVAAQPYGGGQGFHGQQPQAAGRPQQFGGQQGAPQQFGQFGGQASPQQYGGGQRAPPQQQQAPQQQFQPQQFQPQQQYGGQGAGQPQFRSEQLYQPSQLQQQRCYADDPNEQGRLEQIKREQQAHQQNYQQSLNQHEQQAAQAQCRPQYGGTDYSGGGNRPHNYQGSGGYTPRADQLQSQQFADDDQEQARLKQVAMQNQAHQNRYLDSLKKQQQEAQVRNKFMFGGMDYGKK